ncbi:hypothetical protein H2203_002488 [Taxawa tesnikishii (nom. ined.)]|nr:hypothetical protein H2203_002488 [Dothideales sp. JES 119]
MALDDRRTPEYTLEIFADRTCVKEIARDQRVSTLIRQLDVTPTSSTPGSPQHGQKQRAEGGRGQLVVQFMEKKQAYKVRQAIQKSLQKTALKIINIVNRDRNHIPPITTNEANPFPYQILVNPKNDGWGQRMGIF